MGKVLQNLAAVVVGIIAGGAVNMALIIMSPMLIPPPEGIDATTTEGLKASIHLFEPRHFLMPFLAHALGTFVGAFGAYLIAASWRVTLSLAIGLIFLCGGIAASFMIPAPAWFIAIDLLVAYLPMALLATRIGRWIRPEATGSQNLV